MSRPDSVRVRGRARAGALVLLLAALGAPPVATGVGFLPGPAAVAAQDVLTVTDGTSSARIELGRQRGYAALPASELGRIGWRFSQDGGTWIGRIAGVVELRARPGDPFVQLGQEWVQLVDPPFLYADDLYLPVQLLVDVFPDRLAQLYEVTNDGDARRLTVLESALWGAGFTAPTAPVPAPEARAEPAAPRTRVVIIDPGHGGDDPGTLGPNQTREKDIALAIAMELRDALEGTPGLEVHMIRETDVLIPLWERGEIATRIKGDRPGVFLSIHANSVPGMRDVRGFETYFLSEARTEHEARVAALENSAMELEGGPSGGGFGNAELGGILNELRNLDHQHWSSDLASRVQTEVMKIHPGRDRGVKQGPLAVLTNALMPSVLIEVGFISNPDEERLLRDPVFHRDIAERIARATLDFFERYPPGVPGLGTVR